MYSIAFALIWQAIGYYMVMYMASMSSIPAHYYEAAELDGCGKIKQFFTITLPLVWSNIRTTLTFSSYDNGWTRWSESCSSLLSL